MLQSISFRLFAVIAYILLFLTHRLSALRIDEIEMVDVTEKFSMSGVAFGKINKFFDYFGVEPVSEITVLSVMSIIILAFGVAVLAMSLFGFKRLQIVNFCISCVGTALNIALAILVTVYSSNINGSEIGDIMVFEPVYFILWAAPALFLIGTLFIYAYAKMPAYTLSEGRFFTTLGAALNPKYFFRTFKSYDDTEDLFRTSVPLKKKKYASISKPTALKKIKKRSKNRGGETAPNSKKLSPLELALNKREHAEAIANKTADEINRSLFKKQEPQAKKAVHKKKTKSKTKKASHSALDIAKQRAVHAEEVANINNELY